MTNQTTLNSFVGEIHYYRIYDIGWAVDLKIATAMLEKKNSAQTFKLNKSNRKMVMNEAPLVISLGDWTITIFDKTYPVKSFAKLWSFGALSITYRIQVGDAISIEELKKISRYLEDDQLLTANTLEKAREISEDLKVAIRGINIWDQFEDYLIFVVDAKKIPALKIENVLAEENIFQLLLQEQDLKLGHQVKDHIRDSVYQYSDNDFVIIDWSSALVYSEDDKQDIADVIEFALCQLLELRYYDDQLDRQLNVLYKSIQQNSPSVFTANYSKFAKEASLIYIDMSEIIERIENSLKIIGDFFYAKIFRASTQRFRVQDWQQSVDKKLKNLADISVIFQNEINEKRNQMMEIVIIVLIAVEVVPLVLRFVF
ncbi:MAG: hypothetical protein A2504_07255 [Bdellovibrionales bacterium RIFOXYD12_FULL_39_22]|nr:MAG: hypothetical protein A2385_16625 [Bdellovibrionales bacterium RIFOXYB1_FULL_39_21]OFZ44675.1 MAG: hypothetical protein A2485_14485 [Bdellovibrionales bacterium RIFOXYC12_FULL_39_17]OFZ49305.1 MAG: hypothetical protein A2404_08780 [Bdellovibrionales bacterium RIFOXYC1_FULL_39_130]OFZ72594.1 MAG: hypothetical protein A2451_00740 [Bdellovibrionales bacterium RIFOXYC2_FULL_39_8]OFZ77041.1 MAG: hypothetical protein A2560_09745 [Bdellovibrionales bacterium RIFOXYD1_FULL_39_84]OFZ95301.1 MAG: